MNEEPNLGFHRLCFGFLVMQPLLEELKWVLLQETRQNLGLRLC